MFLSASFYKIKYNKNHNNYTLIIKDNSSNSKFFSFSISSIDAKNISLANNNIFSSKLNMYDLFLSLLTLIGYKIEKILILNKNNKIHSQICLKSKNNEFILDSYVVDSLILSMKSISEIYIDENLLHKSKIFYIDDDIKKNTDEAYFLTNTVDTLRKTLMHLVQEEKYELAAKIRDKIKNLEDS
tara:strand:- start:39 stop:593 length:555 start_codon:yes stop_codon:yes gene_type:complete